MAETLPREELRALQLQRLRETVARVLRGQPLGAERLHQAGIAAADDLRSLEDLTKVPFFIKDELRNAYPFDLLAVPREQLLRLHASSGTRGKPTVVGYTKADLDTWTELMARCMTMAGVRPGMLIHNANGYGLFTGGLGFHQGGERIGATVVPVSGGFNTRQAMLLRDLGAQVLVATPSYALVIAQALADGGIDPASTPLELGLFGGEPWTEALPLIRYRTGDLGALTEEPCRCGRTTARLTRLSGRRDDMVIVRGVNVYPSQVEHLLLNVHGVAPHWRLIVERPGFMDELTLECEPSTLDGDRDGLRQTLERNLREGLGVRITIKVLDPGSVPRSEGKAVRVVDRR